MRLYKLNPTLWPKNRNRIVQLQSTMWGSGLLVGMFIAWIPRRNEPIELFLRFFPPYFVVFLAVVTFLTWRKITKARRRYESFELKIGELGVTRKQTEMVELTLTRAEVVSVQEVKGKGFMVKSADPMKFIWIPDELIGYAEVTTLLSTWAPAEAARTSMPFMFNGNAGVVIAVAAMLGMYLVQNPYIVTAVATVFIGFLIYGALYRLRSPNVAASARRSVWTAVLAIVLVLMRALAVWR